jgi:membrane protein required for colicin V production
MPHIESFNWFDFVIIAIIGISIIISLFRGFLREMISLLSWVVGVILALKYAHVLAAHFGNIIDSVHLRYLVAFVLIVVGVIIVGAIINAIVGILIRKSGGIGVLNRLVGILFGFARGVLAVAVVIMMLQVSNAVNSGWYSSSQLAPHFKSLVSWLKQNVPGNVHAIGQWIHKQNS